jgi:hypothetical protein
MTAGITARRSGGCQATGSARFRRGRPATVDFGQGRARPSGRHESFERGDATRRDRIVLVGPAPKADFAALIKRPVSVRAGEVNYIHPRFARTLEPTSAAGSQGRGPEASRMEEHPLGDTHWLMLASPCALHACDQTCGSRRERPCLRLAAPSKRTSIALWARGSEQDRPAARRRAGARRKRRGLGRRPHRRRASGCPGQHSDTS